MTVPTCLQERADVFAESVLHRNGEAALAGHVEVRAGIVDFLGRLSVQSYLAASCNNLHALSGTRRKVIRSRTDESQGFLFTLGKKHGMADDVSVEIDIRFGGDRYTRKTFWKRGHERRLADEIFLASCANAVLSGFAFLCASVVP